MKMIDKGVLLLAVTLFASSSVRGAVIYDNSQNDLNIRFNPGLIQVGDEMTFGGTERYLSGFSLEYYGLSTTPGVFAGNVQARVQFYYNDGQAFNGYDSPGTSFYDSDWFSISPTYDVDPQLNGRSTLIFSRGADNIPTEGLLLPDTMTFSVQFQGMGAGDEVGIDSYGPVVVGSSYPDYWEYDGSAWALKSNAAGAINFAAVFEATPVPEPATGLILALGLAALVGVRRE